MLSILFFIIGSALLYYWYLSKQLSYWEERGIPGPKPVLLFGNLLDMWYNGKARSVVLYEWSKEYGKVYGIHDGLRKVLVTSDIEMTNEILVKQFDNFHGRIHFPIENVGDGPKTLLAEARGAQWKRLRALGSHAFTNTALKQIHHTVENTAVLMTDELERRTDMEVNMLEIYQEYALDIICKVALGQRDVVMFKNPLLQVCRDIFTSTATSVLNTIPLLFPFLQRPMYLFLDTVGRFFGQPFFVLMRSVVVEVEKRKKERADGIVTSIDFIDLFLDAEVDTAEMKFGEDASFSRTLVFDEIVMLAFQFLLAGFETTANSLSFLTYFLALHPDVQEKVREEIDVVFSDGVIEYDSLSELKYTECVIRESLRHYPVAGVATSVCGHRFEPGDMVQTETFALHFDPATWGEDAEQFRPERWLETSDRARITFQSFGEGPRICIGMRMAYIEEKVAIAQLLSKFVVEKTDNTMGMCSNAAALRQMDILEPYSTIGAVTIRIATYTNALYVYYRLLRYADPDPAKRFSKNLYFRLFITLGFVDMISFAFNLLRYRLALLRPFNDFHASIKETALASAICVIHNFLPRTQLMGQIVLSVNRLLAIRAPVFYMRNEHHFLLGALGLIFGIPLVFTIPDMLMGYRFVPIPNVQNETIFCSGGWPGTFTGFAFATLTTYQFVFTAIALALNLFLFETFLAFNSGKSSAVTTVGGGGKSRGTSLEQGLIATTIATFTGHFTYSCLQVSYIYIANLIPDFKYANRGTTITLDCISILNVWLLLLFSHTVRSTVFPSLFPPAGVTIRAPSSNSQGSMENAYYE